MIHCYNPKISDSMLFSIKKHNYIVADLYYYIIYVFICILMYKLNKIIYYILYICIYINSTHKPNVAPPGLCIILLGGIV